MAGQLAEVGWDGPEREKLWRYNQHYFDDLNAEAAETRTDWHRQLVQDWVAKNPPGQGTGWEPYPTSLRIVNWIKWALAGHSLPQTCLHSLATQARWLSGRLEIHLLGNHLFANAKALVFAGTFFDGPEAEKWLRKGIRIIERELPEQILADGGHFERSTMYHALAVEDLLDLINLARAFPDSVASDRLSDRFTAILSQSLHWLSTMSHPDGEIAFFNDAALGIAPSNSELMVYAARLGFEGGAEEAVGPAWLKDSGYIRMAVPAAVALLDVAPVGPDYLPGHAHADTLSFELSVHGQRLLVNSGTSCYGDSTERLRQRGTAAHNTVIVDGKDSSEVWGGFRVARRARPIGLRVALDEQPLVVECGHDGYAHLPGRPMHKRRWILEDGSLVVEDQVSDIGKYAEARFHFHPGVRLENGRARLPNGERIYWEVSEGKVRLEESTWHPGFGEHISNQVLCVMLTDGKSRVRWRWA